MAIPSMRPRSGNRWLLTDEVSGDVNIEVK